MKRTTRAQKFNKLKKNRIRDPLFNKNMVPSFSSRFHFTEKRIIDRIYYIQLHSIEMHTKVKISNFVRLDELNNFAYGESCFKNNYCLGNHNISQNYKEIIKTTIALNNEYLIPNMCKSK